eukprot:CAMPEP_0183396142 /NCGR_PEP_ID=MMETSP0370-20130417/9822_1 /TAXON_ID=268820 /ORGANISM="Peridinium aciculiferum, Strain PAER-2" /LENGTH=56 /DNA_ID=CAMNT_0025576891 /DNA_START=118 /DNA_END=284 /DNA_ORIENTATION=+
MATGALNMRGRAKSGQIMTLLHESPSQLPHRSSVALHSTTVAVMSKALSRPRQNGA